MAYRKFVNLSAAQSLHETPATVVLERTDLLAQIFAGCGWGVTLVLYLLSMQALALRNRREWFLPLFSTCIFVVGTMYLIGSMFIGCKIFIDDRNIEGGPSQALVDIYWEPIVVMADVSFPLQSWLTDGLIIFRCFVIYSYNYWVILFPSFLLVGSLGLGIALNTELSRPGVGFWAKISKDLTLPWFSCSIALNIVVTFLIVFRLLWHRKMIISALGAQHANQYVSISAMLIESATLSATCSIIFLILYARGNAVSTVFQDLVSYCQISASLLIILRVAKGHAWSGATTATRPAHFLISGSASLAGLPPPWHRSLHSHRVH